MSSGHLVTALQFMTAFRQVSVLGAGRDGDVCWMEIRANEDGTEDQLYFVMERTEPPCDGDPEVQVRFMRNPSSVVTHEAKKDAEVAWRSGRFEVAE